MDRFTMQCQAERLSSLTSAVHSPPGGKVLFLHAKDVQNQLETGSEMSEEQCSVFPCM